MKKLFLILVILLFIASADAAILKRSKRPLVEIGPKASLYIGSVRFGIGAEIAFNPLKNVGFRMDFTELSFGDYTQLHLNYIGSFDALIYIPMRGLRGINPYLHTGFGLNMVDTDAGSETALSLRAGMGITYPWSKTTDLFIEPGIIIADPGAGDTETTFRLSFGGRFGILK